MIVRIDVDREGRYSCRYVSGDVETQPRPDGSLDFNIESIEYGPGVDLSNEMAYDFVQGWMLYKLENPGKTRFDKVLEGE